MRDSFQSPTGASVLSAGAYSAYNDAADVDNYRIEVKKGQRISAEIEAARLGVERGITVAGIQAAVAEEPIERAMDLIRSPARHDVDLTTRAFSKLSAVIAGLDLELFDRVDRRPDYQEILVLIGVHCSI